MSTFLFEAYSGVAAHSLSTGDNSLPPLTSFGGEPPTNFGRGELPPIVQVSSKHKLAGVGLLPLILGYGGAVPANFGRGDLPLIASYGSTQTIETVLNIGIGFLPPITSTGAIILHHTLEGDGVLPPIFGRGYYDSFNFGAGDLPPIDTTGFELPPDTFFFAGAGPGFMELVAGVGTLNISELVIGTDSVAATYDKQIKDYVVANAAVSAGLSGVSLLTSFGVAADQALNVTLVVLDSIANAVDTPVLSLQALLTLADSLVATGAVTSQLAAYSLIAEVVTTVDAAHLVTLLGVSDTAASTDALASLQSALVSILDTAAATTAVGSSLQLLAIIDSTADADDTVAAQLAALLDAASIGEAFVSLTLEGEGYVTYSMSLVGAAVSAYEGYDFNSFAVIGGRAYGASSTGTYLLEGDDDAGTQIDARVRVGMSNLGTGLKKSVPAIYVGYKTDGQLAVKVTTTSSDKQKRENWYALSAKPRGSLAEDRTTPSKGLQSVYWDFELVNIDGADFEFDEMRVWRLPLSRRK